MPDLPTELRPKGSRLSIDSTPGALDALAMQPIHATCVVLADTAVLLRGPSGCGKSDLALRLIDRGARLIADDRVALVAVAGQLVAQAPLAIAGLLEVRGLGPVPVPWVAEATVGLAVDLVPSDAVERMPEPAYACYHEIRVPLLALDPFAASTPAKLRLAARALAQSGGEMAWQGVRP